MKRHFFILYFALLYFGVYGVYAQKNIDLEKGTIFASKLETKPKRVIEYVSDGIIATYYFDHVDILSNTNYKEDNFIEIAVFAQNHEEFRPSLPQRWDSFIVPIGKTAIVEVMDSLYVDCHINLSPSIPMLTEYEVDSFSEFPQIRQFAGYWPLKNISTSIREYRGYEIIDVQICPVKYNMSDSIARICKKLSYKITWADGSTLNKKKKIKSAILKSSVINPFQIEDISKSHELTEDYLIITTPTFSSAAEKFKEWKRVSIR